MKRALAAVALPLFTAASLTYAVATGNFPMTPSCLVTGPGRGGPIRLDPAQVTNAQIMVGVARQNGLPLRAAVIAVATAKQESDLHNLAYGDRDSLGLFQQRPSQGWGTPQQILNPVRASSRFYARLVTVPGWETLPLTVAAQAVQRSANATAYAQWQGPRQPTRRRARRRPGHRGVMPGDRPHCPGSIAPGSITHPRQHRRLSQSLRFAVRD